MSLRRHGTAKTIGPFGSLLFIVKPEKQPAVRQTLSQLLEVPIRHEEHGSRVLLPFEH
jgi:hypothetical protein